MSEKLLRDHINMPDESPAKLTPLMHAIIRGNTIGVAFLLEHGAAIAYRPAGDTSLTGCHSRALFTAQSRYDQGYPNAGAILRLLSQAIFKESNRLLAER